MDCSTPGLPVHHQPPGANSNSCPLSQWCRPTISSSVVPFSSHFQSFPAAGSFQMSQFITSGGQSIEVSASALVLPMNIQDCFPLGWTGWISLESMVLSRVFSNTTVWVTNNYYWHCVTVFGLSLFSCTLVSLGFTWDGITEFLSTILIFSHWPSVLKVCGSLSSSVRGGEEALYHVVCRILVPQSGIEPMLPTVEVQSPSHQTAREVPLSRSNRLIKMRFSKIICMCML